MFLHIIPMGTRAPDGDDLLLLAPHETPDRLNALVAAAEYPWVRPRDTVFGILVPDARFRARWDDIIIHMQ